MTEPNDPKQPENTSAEPSETKSEAVDAAAKPTAPKAAAPKPQPPKKPPAKTGPTRRFFLASWFDSWIAIGWWTMAASLTGMLLGTVRFLFPNVLSEPPSSFLVGDVANFEEGIVTDQYKDQGVWVIRSRDDQNRDTIYALSTTCTHLGCTPNWLEGERKFKCPCHGSGFFISGVNFEGPAPRPLERYAVSRTEDNQVRVDKSQKFQKELDQWAHPDSYILL